VSRTRCSALALLRRAGTHASRKTISRRHSGAACSAEPGIHNHGQLKRAGWAGPPHPPVAMDSQMRNCASKLATSWRPGMTSAEFVPPPPRPVTDMA